MPEIFGDQQQRDEEQREVRQETREILELPPYEKSMPTAIVKKYEKPKSQE